MNDHEIRELRKTIYKHSLIANDVNNVKITRRDNTRSFDLEIWITINRENISHEKCTLARQHRDEKKNVRWEASTEKKTKHIPHLQKLEIENRTFYVLANKRENIILWMCGVFFSFNNVLLVSL